MGLQNPQEIHLYAENLKECTDERPTTFHVEYRGMELDVSGFQLEYQADPDPEICDQEDEDQVGENLQKKLYGCAYPHSQEALHHAQRVQQDDHHDCRDIADEDVARVECLVFLVMKVVDEGPQEKIDLYDEG